MLMLRGRYDDAAQPVRPGRRHWPRVAIIGHKFKANWGNSPSNGAICATAAHSFETALRLLGLRVPRNIVLVSLLLIWETLIQLLHSLLPALLLGRIKRPPSKNQQLSLRSGFSRLAHAYWFVCNKIPRLLGVHLRGLNLAERYQPSLVLGQAYSEHAPGMSLIGLYKRRVA